MASSLRELAFTEIREFVNRRVTVFSPDETASKVLGVLKETDRYEAVVSSDGSVGIITVRDLLGVVQPSRTKIEGIWRATSVVSPGDPVVDFVKLLVRNNIRAMPVVEEGRAVGIVSQVDLISALCDVPELSGIHARELVRSPVLNLDIDEKVSFARRLMLERGISHIPVLEYGRLVGVVTAADIVHTFIIPASRTTYGERSEVKVTRFPGIVSGVMDVHPFTVGPDASALDVVSGMKELWKSACFMTDERDKILGILTPRELLPLLLRFSVEEELPVYIMGLTDEDFFESAIAEEKVRRVVTRSRRFRPDITEVSVRIKRSQTRGIRTRYELTARALTKDGQINVKAEGWDLLQIFDELCETLGNAMGRTKPEHPGRQRRRRSRR